MQCLAQRWAQGGCRGTAVLLAPLVTLFPLGMLMHAAPRGEKIYRLVRVHGQLQLDMQPLVLRAVQCHAVLVQPRLAGQTRAVPTATGSVRAIKACGARTTVLTLQGHHTRDRRSRGKCVWPLAATAPRAVVFCALVGSTLEPWDRQINYRWPYW